MKDTVTGTERNVRRLSGICAEILTDLPELEDLRLKFLILAKEENEENTEEIAGENADAAGLSLKMLSLCSEASQTLRKLCGGEGRDRAAVIGTAASVLCAAAEGAGLAVYGDTRHMKDRKAAKQYNSRAKKETEEVRRGLQKVLEESFLKLTSL